MSHVLDHLPVAGKVTGEVVALGTIGGVLLDKLPLIAAGAALVWHCLLIYDWAVKKYKESGRREEDQKKNKKIE